MTLLRFVALGVALFGIAQLVPYGRAHTNPAKLGEPPWNSQDTRTTFMRTCGDCHSNETTWPWYSFVAPASWLVQRDVNAGRWNLNVSEWGRERRQHGVHTSEMVEKGEMPPWFYLPLHAEAKLTEAEATVFIAGLEATFGKEKEHEEHEHDH